MKQQSLEGIENIRTYLEGVTIQLEYLAFFAKAALERPVVVAIDAQSPWVTETKLLLDEVAISQDVASSDGFLKGYGGWAICEIAAKSSPEIAEFLLNPPTDPKRVKVIMFYKNDTGLRIACSDILTN